jgi:hypothetical protein
MVWFLILFVAFLLFLSFSYAYSNHEQRKKQDPNYSTSLHEQILNDQQRKKYTQHTYDSSPITTLDYDDPTPSDSYNDSNDSSSHNYDHGNNSSPSSNSDSYDSRSSFYSPSSYDSSSSSFDSGSSSSYD